MNAKLSLLRCDSYSPKIVEEKVRQAVDLIGGISSFIKPSSRVLVKPNLLSAKEPEFGITTHPEVVRATVKILKGINCKVFLGDGPSVWGREAENVDRVYEKTGMKKICGEEKIELVKFDRKRWRKEFPLTTWLDECDYLVNIPKFKTHNLMLMTAGIKNLFGLVWGTHKTELHKKYFDPLQFSRILVDIYEEAKPALTIVDGVTAMEGDGPGSSGKLREMNLLIAGKDCVAIDSVLAVIMGLKPFDVLTTKEASIRNLGISDLKHINICGGKLENFATSPFILPSTSLKQKLTPIVFEMIKRFIKYRPVSDRSCVKCGACIGICPNKAVAMKNKRIVFDYSKCISCFCCQEVCPASAIKIKKSVIAKILGV